MQHMFWIMMQHMVLLAKTGCMMYNSPSFPVRVISASMNFINLSRPQVEEMIWPESILKR